VKIPGANRAVLDPVKLRDYLLSHEHPIGRTKAEFFGSLGFSQGEWPLLEAALREIVLEEATPGQVSVYGQKYESHAIMQGPNGRRAHVTVVWIVRTGEDFPRLVTAYPGSRR
jgi:hypothetical protein